MDKYESQKQEPLVLLVINLPLGLQLFHSFLSRFSNALKQFFCFVSKEINLQEADVINLLNQNYISVVSSNAAKAIIHLITAGWKLHSTSKDLTAMELRLQSQEEDIKLQYDNQKIKIH